jgi:hypothetical protein
VCFFVYAGESPASAEAQRSAKPFVSFALFISVKSSWKLKQRGPKHATDLPKQKSLSCFHVIHPLIGNQTYIGHWLHQCMYDTVLGSFVVPLNKYQPSIFVDLMVHNNSYYCQKSE